MPDLLLISCKVDRDKDRRRETEIERHTKKEKDMTDN